MTGMTMPQYTWYGAAAGYLGIWMAMMVPMMLPSLIPMLSRYRRSVRGAAGIHPHGLTALVAVGYFAVWAALGAVAYAAGAGVMAVEMRWEAVAQWLPVAAGVVLLGAGGVQLTPWKARQLALCREESGCGGPPAPDAMGAWRHGLRMGGRCSLCCGNLMLALLAIGMMDLAAMAAVTLAISAERLAPVPLRVARAVGVAIVVLGLLTIGDRFPRSMAPDGRPFVDSRGERDVPGGIRIGFDGPRRPMRRQGHGALCGPRRAPALAL